MLALLTLTLLAADVVRPFAEERVLLDRRLETLRRILPDGPNAAADVTLVRELATNVRLTRLEIAARPPAEAGARGDVILDLSGTGRFGDLDRFFRQVALSARLIDVESLTLSSSPDDLVKLTTVLRLPYRPLRAPLPPVPEGLRGRPGGIPRPTAEAFVRDQGLALAKSEAIAALRRSRRNPRLFLSEIAAIVRDRPVTLSFASLGEEFQIRGPLGRGRADPGPREPLRTRLFSRVRFPDGAPGRLPTLRGAGQGPRRGDRSRAAPSCRRSLRAGRGPVPGGSRRGQAPPRARAAGQRQDPGEGADQPASARHGRGGRLPGAAPPDLAGLHRGRRRGGPRHGGARGGHARGGPFGSSQGRARHRRPGTGAAGFLGPRGSPRGASHGRDSERHLLPEAGRCPGAARDHDGHGSGARGPRSSGVAGAVQPLGEGPAAPRPARGPSFRRRA